jgi:hypothetical protein
VIEEGAVGDEGQEKEDSGRAPPGGGESEGEEGVEKDSDRD